MIASTARCPTWLIDRLKEKGGSISFYGYMDLVLNDPENGFYSTGRLNIGKDGDFCTSPSLSNDFAHLLAIQVVDWLLDLKKFGHESKLLSLVEIGPGEGTLSRDLILAIAEIAPALISEIELVLVELNAGMRERQEKVVNKLNGISYRWSNIEDLTVNPVTGVVIANEVLDAFPVERLIFDDNKVFRQGVSLKKINDDYFLEFVDLKPTSDIKEFLKDSKSLLKIDEFPPKKICNRWITEWHCDLPVWFKKLSKVLINGPLLIVDYAMESKRYYNAMRKDGTLISYRNQVANSNILNDAGLCDLTAHLCIESTINYALTNGWKFMGETRQGQALLALGLSRLLYSIQNTNINVSAALNRREALLRLVDPMGLGDFRWFAFKKNNCSDLILRNRFLEEPIS